ncbi:MAG: response regulator [Desulfobacteraceae bacterium]|nr:response regulator [Desulfobacteraceae bacterium]MBC2721031.1 response regulator [Desulfobacteraceae bacterium]
MNILNKITIKSRMVLAFVLMLLIFVLFGLFSIIEMKQLGELTSTMYEHPFKVLSAVLKAKAGAIRMHRSMKDVSVSPTEMELHIAIQAVQSEEKTVYQYLDIAQKQILGKEGKDLVQETMEMFAGWKPIRLEVEQLVLKKDREAAARITRGKGADYVSRLERNMIELASYAADSADIFMENARDMQHRSLRNTIIFICIVALLAFIIAWFMITSIISSVSTLKNTMSEITKTGTLTKTKLSGNNEITEISRHFNDVIDRLQDEFWLKDGQTKLAKELPGDLPFDDFVIRSINFISRYVNACTGALYVYNEKHSLCQLKASFVFTERKFFSSEFKLGEGIVGQVAVEKKPILLKGITREEALGNTGTLSEPPKSIYAIPLLYEEKLYGVLEVASFEEIDKLKVEFMDTTARILSISLYSVLQKMQIEELLQTSQESRMQLEAQTEELQAQTDELQAQSEELQQTSEELQEQNVELEVQSRQVEEANRLKSEFLSNMSHELRTPLNSVMALSRVLMIQAKDNLSKEEISYLEIIERNGKQLLSLINDILDLSRIEAGRMDIRPKVFSIRSTIETILERLEPMGKEKGIDLHQEIQDNLPQIESDEQKVHQILQNLLVNAVKFTEKGHVTVSAHSDADKFYIEVADTGIGMSNKDLPYIFEEFRQIDGTSSRPYTGVGLGLAIAYKTAKILGGDLSVKSTPGKGTTFFLTLPLKWQGIVNASEPPGMMTQVDTSAQNTILAANDESEIENRHKCQENKKPETGARILVVEDNEAAVIQIREVLESEGYKVDVVRGGQEALEYVKQTIPKGIILDLMMPEVDGFEVLEKIRGAKTTAKIPVLILTAKDLTAEDFKKLGDNNIQQLIQKGDVDRQNLLFKTRLMLGTKPKVKPITRNPTTGRNLCRRY